MKRVDIRGTIIPNGYKWYYDFFGEDSTCPKDVQDAMDAAGGDVLEVYISSGGGVIEAGSEIYTALKKYQGEVRMYITGVAHSAASVIAMARHCEMSPTALMMVHCVSSSASGNHNDLEKQARVLRTADRAMCTAYMEKTGMDEAKALAMMEKETWLTASQAKGLGMVDGIMFEGDGDAPGMIVGSMYRLPSQGQMDRARKMLAEGGGTAGDGGKDGCGAANRAAGRQLPESGDGCQGRQKAQAALRLLAMTGGKETYEL